MTESSIVTNACEAPALWIERVVIYGNHAKGEVIRDLSFLRGLNIIWGVSQPGQDGNASEDAHLVGHSVGKTTLCRLIRYVLDEDSFGQKEASERIKERFPDGAVGATLYLKGTKWSVLRKFRDKDDSRAAQDSSVEDLSELEPNEYGYPAYSRALRESFSDGLPGYGSEHQARCTWHDLLAWMSRDQEARFQNLWHWREHRSNTQEQQLSKEDALKLMRSVIGIYSETEATLLREREQLSEDRDKAKIALGEQEHVKRVREEFVDEALKRILDTYTSSEPEFGELFSTSPAAAWWLGQREEQLRDLHQRREQVQLNLAGYRVDEREIRNRVAVVHSHLETLRFGTEDTSDDDRLQGLQSVQGRDCTYGDIPFAECKYVLAQINKLKDPYSDFLRKLRAEHEGNEEQLRAAGQSWVAEKMFLSAELEGLRKNISDLEINDKQLESEIAKVSSDMCRLHSYKADKEQIRTDLTPAISVRIQEISDLDRAISELGSTLGHERMRHDAVCQEFGQLFNRLIQRVLPGSYSGEVVFSPKERLDFRIRGLSGEAVQTLSSIFADISAMLWSVEGKGYHPRFLIHDSPREADLSGGAYASFLRHMHQISEELGGKDAPFQYFVTTTTSPPEELVDAECVRLKLSSQPTSEMLFRDNIALTLDGMDADV